MLNITLSYKYMHLRDISVEDTRNTGEDTDPQTRFAKPTIIPEAKIAYPALRDSGA
jgi:hypothetical protein